MPASSVRQATSLDQASHTKMSTPSYPAIPQEHYHDAYPFNGKIMVVAVASLLVITSFVFLLHVYAKWWFFTQSRGRRLSLPDLPPMLSQQLQRLTIEPLDDGHVADGLDSLVIASLPTFIYKWDAGKNGLECVVCLSLFEENDKGRILPKCQHAFHVDCIDMWLMSHSTCPLCRNVVVGMEEAAVKSQEPGHSLSRAMLDSTSAHGLDGNRQLEIVVEVPMGSRFDIQASKDSSCSSSSSSSCTLSESLKRMLSRSRSESRVFPSSDHASDR